MRHPFLSLLLSVTVAAAVVVVLLGLALGAPPHGPVATAAGAALVLAGPSLAVALPLRGLSPLARAVLGLAATVVVDTGVALVMVDTRRWSHRGGLVAVAVVSLLLLLLVVWSSDGDGVATGPRARGGGEP